MTTWNGLRRSPMKRKPRTRAVLPAAVRARVLAMGACAFRFAEQCNGRMTIEHVVPVALRRRYAIAHDDERFLVPACISHNVRKGTRKLYPRGFDTSLLPGRGWIEWDGGRLPEVLR